MSSNYLGAEEGQHQQFRYDLEKKLSSMKKSWSIDSLTSLSGGDKSCICAPTKHEGSFRCRHHRRSSSISLSQAQLPAPPKLPTSQEVDEEAK